MDRQGVLTERFDEAVGYALQAHDRQQRKGTEIPYAAHLLGVASLILEAGGTEDEAIAGLLHDVVEDQGGAPRLTEVRGKFGDEIADIVLECSAEDKTDDPGWRVRKKRHLAAIETCSDSALGESVGTADGVGGIDGSAAGADAHPASRSTTASRPMAAERAGIATP